MLIVKNSIIRLVGAFFLFSFIIINIALVLEYHRQVRELHHFVFQRFIMSIHYLHNLRKKPLDITMQLKDFGVMKSEYTKEYIQKNGRYIEQDPFSALYEMNNKFFFIQRERHMQENQNMPFGDFFPQKPPEILDENIVLESLKNTSVWRYYILVFFIDAIMVLFSFVVFKKLFRLRELKNQIRICSNSDKFQPMVIQGNDELAQITEEFNSSMKKIHKLKEARTLFLRNILHEIKTPIMKGKIVTNSLEAEEKKEQLQRVFERFEALLVEMLKVEKLSSNEWKLDFQEYRLVDVVDHAKDLLMCDTSRIELHVKENLPLIGIDFELFSTALKNLLDNALKYSYENVDVTITEKTISVASLGDEIEEEQLDFSKIFNRKVEGSSSGLGLGLYIVNEIVLKHGFVFRYEHEEQVNRFIIYLV